MLSFKSPPFGAPVKMECVPSKKKARFMIPPNEWSMSHIVASATGRELTQTGFIHLEAYASAARAFDTYQVALAMFAEGLAMFAEGSAT
jgi:hypothetical protein